MLRQSAVGVAVVVVAVSLLMSGTAWADPVYSIDPPKGSRDAAFNRDYVRGINSQAQAVIDVAKHKVGLKQGEKVPLSTWLCVAYTLAANGMEAGRRMAGINQPGDMELDYRAKQRKFCEDGDDGRKGVEIFKEAQRMYGQKFHNREALDDLGTAAQAVRLLDAIKQLASGAASATTAPAPTPAGGWLIILNPELFMPRKSDPQQGL